MTNELLVSMAGELTKNGIDVVSLGEALGEMVVYVLIGALMGAGIVGHPKERASFISYGILIGLIAGGLIALK